MNIQRNLSAAGVGFVTAVIAAVLMLIGVKNSVSPLPEPLGLAFAESLLDTKLSLAVGFGFHAAWVIFWTLVYVRISPAIRFLPALALAAALWVSALVISMPIAGWGFLGLAVTPKLIVAAIIAHLIFAVLIWGGCRLLGMSEQARAIAYKLAGKSQDFEQVSLIPAGFESLCFDSAFVRGFLAQQVECEVA